MKKAIIWVLVCMLVGILSRITFVQWTNAISIEMRHLEAIEQNNLALQQNLAFSEQLARNIVIRLQNRIADDGRAPTISVIQEAAQSYQLHYTIQQELKLFQRTQKLDTRESLTAPLEKVPGSTPKLDALLQLWRNRYRQHLRINQWPDSLWSPFSLHTSIRLLKQTELLAATSTLTFSNLDQLYTFAVKIQGCGYCIPQHELKLIPRSRIVTEGSTWEATLLITADNLGSYNRRRPFIELAAYDQMLHSTNAQVSPIPNKPAYTISFLAQSDAFDNQEERQKQWEGQWNVHPHCLPKEEMDTTFSLKVDYTVKKKE